MGADFSEKVKGTYRRHIDKSLVSLNTPELFDQQIGPVSRSFRAEIARGAAPKVGQKTQVRIDHGCLVAMDALTTLAACADPPVSLLRNVESSCGLVSGTISEVHDLAGVVEIRVDDPQH